MKIAIMGAMPQEIENYALIKDTSPAWTKHQIYIGLTGIGKVNAGKNTERTILLEKPDVLIFTGVAGAINPSLELGDLVIGSNAIDSEMDCRSFNPELLRGEIPFSGQRVYSSDLQMIKLAQTFGIKLLNAYIATGSVFLDAEGKNYFVESTGDSLVTQINGSPRVPDVYDMESSAILQVANEHKVPTLLIRAISDTRNGDAPEDFNRFINDAVNFYTPLVTYILDNLN
jgi:5'-methylthioadenosine/S-adenosylhomocysteine nucleosidase